MYSRSTKIAAFGLAFVSLGLSRLRFFFINDPEGPNLLVVGGLALILFAVLFGIYLFVAAGSRLIHSQVMRLQLAVFVIVLAVLAAVWAATNYQDTWLYVALIPVIVPNAWWVGLINWLSKNNGR